MAAEGNRVGNADEYGVDHERNRATSLNRGSDVVVIEPALDDKVVVPAVSHVDGARVVTVLATQKAQRCSRSITYEEVKVLGEGSFGRVLQCLLHEDDDRSIVAIKTVLQDKRFRNRELSFIRQVDHPNIINLKYYFFTRIDHERTASDGNAFLNLVMEYLPETLFGFIQRYNKRGIFVPSVYIKLAMYQITRAMGYLHFQNICHRDIKPHNILINEQSGVVKICDLGSMKKLEPGSPNVSYICSRYFRAPELLLGCQQYSCAIDAWAIGCVMAEMYLRHPIFPGHNTQDQLARIIHILGSPSIAQLKAISLECKKPEVLMQRFPVVSTKKFTDILPEYASNDAIDLLGKLLVYVPQQRSTMPEALCHPFFDELHVSNHKLPNGNSFPPLFNFTNEELQYLQMEELDAE